MRVFVTGATGFIGSAVTKELIANGHQVLGLCRSADKAPALRALGADVLMGALQDEDVLARGVAASDGIIHLGFNHDFSTYLQNCEDDRNVIRLFGSLLAGTKHPLIITSGTGIINNIDGTPAREVPVVITPTTTPRAASEAAAAAVNAEGGNVSIVRLPQVHDMEKQGFVTYVVLVAREKGYCAYIGDGQSRWPAAHVLDVARLYRLALEKAAPGAIYHAVAEEGITLKDIAETVGARLKLPVKSIAQEQSADYFGWLSMMAGVDLPASSAKTQKALGWTPIERGMLEDLRHLAV